MNKTVTPASNDASVTKAASSYKLAGRLLRDFVYAHYKSLGIASICMIIAGAATAGNAWLMQPVLDEIFLKQNKDMLLLLPFAVLGLGLIKGGAAYSQSVIMKNTGQRIVSDMQQRLYAHLLTLDLAFFHAHSTGSLLSRFSNDIQVIRRNVNTILESIAKELVTLVALVGVMFYQSTELSLIAIFVFPAAIIPIQILGRRMRKVTGKTQAELGQFNSLLDDTFQGIKIVKAYHNESYEAERAKGLVERIFQLYVKASRVDCLSSPIMETLAGIAIAAVIWYGGMQVLNGVTTPGAFFSFITALIMAYKPLKSLSRLNANIQEAFSAIDRYYEMMDLTSTISEPKKPASLPLKNNDIEFHNVGFKYNPRAEALKEISFKVPSGHTVALVGESGGGKSTILNLLLRFYDPEKGYITVGGEDIRNVSLRALRERISIVTQETTLFDDTVRANIAYGKRDAAEEEIVDAAYAAAAHDFISELPDGYETRIGQHGVRLSGGQRQRIAIARAMLRNTPILLLDEATSALDSASESQVQEALKRLMKGRTTMVVAHRLSTIIDANTIIVMEAGRIAESGNHTSLLKKNGLYKLLFDRQFRDDKPKEDVR